MPGAAFWCWQKIWETGSGHLRVLLSEMLFLYPAASAGIHSGLLSAELPAEMDGFLAAGQCDPGLARVLADRRDTMERVLRSRALQG